MAQTLFPRELNGRPVSNQEFRDAIAEKVEERKRAVPKQIASDLGWADTPQRQRIVTKEMNNMLRSGWLLRDGGQYSVPESYALRVCRTSNELAIIDTITSFGGMATWSEIMADFGTLPSANKENGHGGRGSGMQGHLLKIMKASKRIVRYDFVNRPLWGLRWEELLKLPLTGRTAEFIMLYGFLEFDCPRGRGGADREKEVIANIEAHYERVGFAFRQAREIEEMESETVVACEIVREALETMQRNARHAVNEIEAEMRRVVHRRACEEGRGEDRAYLDMLFRRERNLLLEYMLLKFESGHRGLHKAAPVTLYYAVAKLLGVCAASLSRGVVARMLTPVELPDSWESWSKGPLSEIVPL